jgi:hypothetical protein
MKIMCFGADPAARLYRVLRVLIRRSFPGLRRVPLMISWGTECELLHYAVESDQYVIRVNACLRTAPRRVLEGGIVHELCHIESDLKLRPYQRELAWARYLNSRWCRMREERATEWRVVELGYGPQLLALIRFAHGLGYSFSREHGLFYAEIVRAIGDRKITN